MNTLLFERHEKKCGNKQSVSKNIRKTQNAARRKTDHMLKISVSPSLYTDPHGLI